MKQRECIRISIDTAPAVGIFSTKPELTQDSPDQFPSRAGVAA